MCPKMYIGIFPGLDITTTDRTVISDLRQNFIFSSSELLWEPREL